MKQCIFSKQMYQIFLKQILPKIFGTRLYGRINYLNSYGPFKSSPSVYLYILRVFVKKIPQTLTRSVNLTHNWKLLCPGPVDPSPRRTHTFRAKGELFEEFYVLSLAEAYLNDLLHQVPNDNLVHYFPNRSGCSPTP